MIPEGNYEAKVVSVQLGVADTGTEQVAVMFTVTDDRAGDDKGAMVPWWGSFTPAAEEFTMQGLTAIGWNPEKIPFDDIENPAHNWNTVSVKVSHEEKQDGKKRPQVAFVNELGGGNLCKNKMDDSGKKTLGARMAALYKSTGQKARPMAEKLEVDDTPF